MGIDNRLWMCFIAMLAATACDKVQLTAPTESKITLFTSATAVPVGGTVEITASVVEQAGTAVQNGTVVNFTTTVGTIEPREARTQNGKVTVRLIAGNTSGKAQVRAFSGSAQSDPLEVVVGGAAVETLLIRANPGTIAPTGGRSEIVATAIDASGNRLPGVPVTFSAAAGQLTEASVVTDGNGEARTTLTTNVQTKVTASAGAKTAEVTIAVSTLPTIGIAVSANPTAAEPVTFTLTLGTTTGASPIQRVVIDFGDRTSETIATSGSTSVAHVYRDPGLYTVTATVYDASGQNSTATAIISVVPKPPFSVVLTASPVNPARLTPVSFTATVNVTGTSTTVVSYFWDFGDETTRSTASNVTSHVYDRVGQRTVSVTVTASDGRTATAITEIIVQ